MSVTRLLLVLLLALGAAHADNELMVGVYTTHVGQIKGKLNENTGLMVYRHNQWAVGTFINSYYRRTYIAGRVWEWGDRWHGGAVAGAQYGYCAEAYKPGAWVSYDCQSVLGPMGAIYFGYRHGAYLVRGATFLNSVSLIIGVSW